MKAHGEELPADVEIPKPLPANEFVWNSLWPLVYPDCRQTLAGVGGLVHTYFDWVQVRTVLEDFYGIQPTPVPAWEITEVLGQPDIDLDAGPSEVEWEPIISPQPRKFRVEALAQEIPPAYPIIHKKLRTCLEELISIEVDKRRNEEVQEEEKNRV